MDITNLLKNNESTAFSFEVLPPLKGKGLDTINNTIELLREFDPKYINITTHHSEVYFRDAGNGLYQVERLRRRPEQLPLPQQYKTNTAYLLCHTCCAADLRKKRLNICL